MDYESSCVSFSMMARVLLKWVVRALGTNQSLNRWRCVSQSSTFITITHKPSFYANNSSSVTGSLTLQHSSPESICVYRELHKFLLALHWCRSAVEIFLGDYHTTIMLSRVSGVYCVHTLKHHNTLNICSRYIKGVLCRRSQSCSGEIIPSLPQPNSPRIWTRCIYTIIIKRDQTRAIW